MTVSLATRCTACGTVFRVVRDQLLVSDGWVRCGRCDAVFDATETLFDIELGEPVLLDGLVRRSTPPGSGPPAAPAPAAFAGDPAVDALPPAGPPSAPLPGHDPLADVVPADWTEHQRRRAQPPDGSPAIDDTPLLRLASADVDPPAQAADMARADAAPPPAATVAAEAVADDRLDGPSLDDAPSFLRAADRAAYWRRPAVRAATSAAILVAAAALVMQAGLLWHDLLAAHVPALAPALRSLCAAAGCTVQPLQRGEQISVESSGLNRVEGSGLYRLQLVLRNRADTVLQLPALDLTLTDNQGRLVARRVLRGADLGLVQDRLERGQELPIRAVLSVGDRRIDGYTVEAFYP